VSCPEFAEMASAGLEELAVPAIVDYLLAYLLGIALVLHETMLADMLGAPHHAEEAGDVAGVDHIQHRDGPVFKDLECCVA
ncbi:MAG: hypothetical protein AAB968_04980, partial [Patescibacteria group bacterium]